MYIILGLIILGIVAIILWGLFSRRQSQPCPVWLSWLLELDNPFTEANKANVIIKNLKLEPGMKVLDAGCGPGRLTIPLAKQIGPQGEVTAMDLQTGMLEIVRKKSQEANLHNIQLLHSGIGEGKLERNQYDRALLVTVLGEIPDREKALKEIFEALKPGGILSVTETVFDPHFQSKGTVIPLALSTGFKEREVIGNRLAYTLHLQKPTGSNEYSKG